jgi:predicted flap endonuclease-1-like 5' DNA nuclease
MGYLSTEIVVYLVIAGLIGFAFGWAVKAGALDKYFDKLVALINKAKEAVKALYLTLTTSKEVVNEETKDVAETAKEVVPETVAEEIKKDVKEVQETKVSVAEVTPKEVTEVIKEDIKVKEETKADVVEKAVVETAKEEVSEVSTPEETSSPVLLTEAPEAGADKLSALKGIGPVLEKKLNELGVYTYEQIASWDAEQELWIGSQMAFPKKVTKEEWVKQAKELLNK